MWVVPGFLIAAAIGLVVVLTAYGRGAVHLDSHPWILHDTAKLHVNILAGLAGFAFTGVVLVVTLARDRTSAADVSLDIVIVMFLVAYLWWIGGAFLISYIPYKEISGDLVPRVHFSLATTLEYRTVFLSWFALLPLLQANGLGRLAPVLYFVLPVSLLCGSVLVSMTVDGLGLMRVWETYLSATVGLILALGYAAAVAFAIPGARSAYSPLYLSLVIFCVNGVGFALASLTPLSPRYAGVKRFYERHGRRIVVADMQLTMVSLALLWLAVVGVI
ncbi:MAG: hypothetical protein ACHP9T_10050 [Caulobacterales bacterium]|jgi:hypothetical protein